jgi:hypothetical protein
MEVIGDGENGGVALDAKMRMPSFFYLAELRPLSFCVRRDAQSILLPPAGTKTVSPMLPL